MTVKRARVRYLLAMGILPTTAVGGLACNRTTTQGTVAARADDAGPVTVATEAAGRASAEDAAVSPAAAVDEPIIERRDAGNGTWSLHETPRLRDVPEPPRATCPSGEFCVAASARPDAGAIRQHAPAPYSECPATAGHFVRTSFRPDLTARERALSAGACCYSWVEPCPGGRPLRDDGGAIVVAQDVARADWSEEPPLAPVLDVAARDRLERHWLREAAAEHASVASFSRFSLQLLAVGAPPDLLVAAHEAALDEARPSAPARDARRERVAALDEVRHAEREELQGEATERRDRRVLCGGLAKPVA
ncbi:MAG TPA: hypothetical protein VM204_05885, partial [Gaiellaceae bacterium]|nr:hypothetical protein [Gaiellaceae bacterium]